MGRQHDRSFLKLIYTSAERVWDWHFPSLDSPFSSARRWKEHCYTIVTLSVGILGTIPSSFVGCVPIFLFLLLLRLTRIYHRQQHSGDRAMWGIGDVALSLSVCVARQSRAPGVACLILLCYSSLGSFR
jgi:hypothetical protein